VLGSLKGLRRRVGAFIGGFEAGLANRRLKGFQPSRAHLNTLIAAAGPDITARARWLVRNNGYAANAIESWAGNVVGAGIKPSSLIKEAKLKPRVQELWLDWTDEADAEGFTDLYGLQRRAASRGVHNGGGVLPFPAEPLDTAEGRDANDERTIDLQPGQITMLEPGEEVQTSAPADSGQTYEPFQYRTLLRVSAALGVPYAYLSNDMLKANYSNSRLAADRGLGRDAGPVTLDHGGELLVRLQPLPLQTGAPVFEEAPCPALALVAPQLPEAQAPPPAPCPAALPSLRVDFSNPVFRLRAIPSLLSAPPSRASRLPLRLALVQRHRCSLLALEAPSPCE
jgi:hypothetical protein